MSEHSDLMKLSTLTCRASVCFLFILCRSFSHDILLEDKKMWQQLSKSLDAGHWSKGHRDLLRVQSELLLI